MCALTGYVRVILCRVNLILQQKKLKEKTKTAQGASYNYRVNRIETMIESTYLLPVEQDRSKYLHMGSNKKAKATVAKTTK